MIEQLTAKMMDEQLPNEEMTCGPNGEPVFSIGASHPVKFFDECLDWFKGDQIVKQVRTDPWRKTGKKMSQKKKRKLARRRR